MSNITNETDYIEQLSTNVPFNFISNLSQNVLMLYTNAKFYRTVYNNQYVIDIPIGNNYSPTLWYSLDVFLPTGIFNSTKPLPEFSFPGNNCVQINEVLKVYHDIQIDYKITKNINGDGFQNIRKIQCLPVRPDNSVYDNSLIGYKQPGPNFRDTLLIQGEINHAAGDIIKLRFNVIQDNEYADQSNTTLTIYKISWNMSTLKII